MFDVHELVIDGVRCAVKDTEPNGNTEAVVFVHGNPGPMDDWDDLLPEAAKLTRAIAMDMPGFGRSDRPDRFEHSVDGYARYLGEIVARAGVRKVHLVAHDFGVGWGLRWAADHPASLASLTLINMGVLRGYRWHRYARIWQTPVIGELFQLSAIDPIVRSAMNRENPRPLPKSFVDRVLKYSDWANKRAVLRIYRATRDVEAAFAAIADRLLAIDPPTCVIWGELDPYAPVVFAERQKETFRRAEVHVLPGLGHWPFVDDPAAVRGILLPFLQRHVGSEPQPGPVAP